MYENSRETEVGGSPRPACPAADNNNYDSEHIQYGVRKPNWEVIEGGTLTLSTALCYH